MVERKPMMRLTPKGAVRLMASAAVVTLLVAVLLAMAATEDDLAKVKVGMSRAQVVEIMGKPDRDQEVKDVENLCRLYAYKKVGRYKLVNIWFDCDDKVQAIDKIR